MRVKPLEKPLEQPWQSHRYYLSRRKETRLAKNRVSVSIPYAFCEKPGFLGVRVERMSVLAPPRNPVGKPQKPGWQTPETRLANPRNPVGKPQKPGWQTPETRLANPRNPVGKKPGFLINALRLSAECFTPTDLWLLLALGKTKYIDRETQIGFIQTYNLLLSLRGGVDAS